MKAMTVRQPWAWAIIHGGKHIENRGSVNPWRGAIGTTIAIHAAKAHDPEHMNDSVIAAALRRPEYVFSAIIGLVDVTGVHIEMADCCAPWSRRGYAASPLVHVELANPRPTRIVACRGNLGLWPLTPAIEAML